MRYPESEARAGPARLTAERGATESDLARGDHPWTKIIQQNQSTRKMSNFVLSPNRWKVGEQHKLKSAIKRREKVVLMTRQNIPWPQCCHGSSESSARIRQCHSQDREIDGPDLCRGDNRWGSAGIDEDR